MCWRRCGNVQKDGHPATFVVSQRKRDIFDDVIFEMMFRGFGGQVGRGGGGVNMELRRIFEPPPPGG